MDFVEATEALEQKMVDEGHFVVRCDHGQGHTLTTATWTLMVDWAVSHRFGEASPWSTGDKIVPDDLCEVASQ